MTIFRRDLISQIVACVLLPLFFFQRFPYVTCEQDQLDTADTKEKIGIIFLWISASVLLFFCLFFALTVCYYLLIPRRQEEGREVLHTGARSGVNKDFIKSFPCFPYSEVKELKIGQGGVECAICLTEFEDEDTVRWMPPCSHIFHANCIDVWLSSRSTCPVCRANLSLNSGKRFSYPSMDLETGNAQRGVVESTEGNANYTTPRSNSTGLLSSWSMAERFVPRSHSTGHSLVQLGENVDRYTLQLPDEVQRKLDSLNLKEKTYGLTSSQEFKTGIQ